MPARQPRADGNGVAIPEPLGSSGRWWAFEWHEVPDNGDGIVCVPAGEYPQGRVPARWRAAFWFALARACHQMAMRCQAEADRQAQP